MPLVTVVTPTRSTVCGFCATGSHDRCAVGTLQGNRTTIHPCLCSQDGCEKGRRKCVKCGNRATDEVDPKTWECFDVDHCRGNVEARREANPLNAELREAYRSANMAKIENAEKKATKEKAAKAPTYCLVTGEETKGGLFKPGMDARYVSNMVEAVTSKNRTEVQARKQMKDDGVSEKLIAKFEKSLDLAKAKAEAAKTAKAEKAAAKA